MKKDENISILIANYNNGKYLEECLNSILDQSSPRWDVYILDDKSPDNSKEIYKIYENNDKINIFYNDDNLGFIRSLKKLIKLSENDIVALLDPDDKLDITAIEKILDYYDKHAKAGFVYSNFWFCDENLNIKRAGFSRPIPPNESAIDFNYVSHFKTFRKSYYDKTLGYDENILYAEDKDLVYKMEEVTKLHFVNEPLYYYRELPESLSHGKNKHISRANYVKAKNNALQRRGEKRSIFYNLFNRKKRKKKIKKKYKVYLLNNKDLAIENLLSAKVILNSLNMDFWLTDGTLLGFHRENDFIGHDFDIDIGCYISQYNDKIITEFISNGWKCEHICGKKELGFELSFKRNHVRLDIFFFYEENDKFWHAAWLDTKKGQNLIKYYYNKFNLKEIEFCGYKFNVPKDTQEYIKTKYGEDWNIPKKNWDWAFDPKNAQKTDYYINY